MTNLVKLMGLPEKCVKANTIKFQKYRMYNTIHMLVYIIGFNKRLPI